MKNVLFAVILIFATSSCEPYTQKRDVPVYFKGDNFYQPHLTQDLIPKIKELEERDEIINETTDNIDNSTNTDIDENDENEYLPEDENKEISDLINSIN